VFPAAQPVITGIVSLHSFLRAFTEKSDALAQHLSKGMAENGRF
jgi:hypothetical protein